MTANAAIDVLLRTIRRKDRSTRVLVDQVVPHRLVVRGSVGAPGKPG